MAIFPLCWNHLHKFCLFLLYILTPSPNGSMFYFNPLTNNSYFHLHISDIVNIGERSLLEDKKSSSLFESGSTVTWEQAFHNLWFNSSANKLAPLPGTILKIIPGKNEKDSKDEGFLWENREYYMWKRLYHFPWRLRWKILEGDSTEETDDRKERDF